MLDLPARGAIDVAIQQLRAQLESATDAATIEAATKALAQATEGFAALRMNRGIANALAGKHIESI